MKVDLLGKKGQWPMFTHQIINDLRKQSLKEGIDPLDFPNWIAKHGVTVAGPIINIDDALVTFAQLKYCQPVK